MISQKWLYQETEIDKIPYAGPERRTEDREDLSRESQLLLSALDKRILSCRANCVLSKEVQDSIPHAVGAVKEVGDGSIARGINNFVGNYKTTSELIDGIESTKSRAWSTVVVVVVLAIVSWIGLGFIQRLKG